MPLFGVIYIYKIVIKLLYIIYVDGMREEEVLSFNLLINLEILLFLLF